MNIIKPNKGKSYIQEVMDYVTRCERGPEVPHGPQNLHNCIPKPQALFHCSSHCFELALLLEAYFKMLSYFPKNLIHEFMSLHELGPADGFPIENQMRGHQTQSTHPCDRSRKLGDWREAGVGGGPPV